jgi:leucine dehydrogenase
MGVFDNRAFDGHEHVSFFADGPLKAILAIHRTGSLGTAGGGCRMWPYPNEEEALRDALRLSRAMTLKMALVGIPAGGAKAVVMGDPAHDKSEQLFLALGRAVDRLGGRFLISEDVGTTKEDLAVVSRATGWVNPLEVDTAPATADGVLVVLRAAVRLRLGRLDLRGLRVAVQGLGAVGRRLCEHLAAEGARLFVTDLDEQAVSPMRQIATPVAPDAIFEQDVDVFAPCALADALSAETLPRLRCKVIAGSANNQLSEPEIAASLAERDIFYAPDIVANAGGVLGALGNGQLLQARLAALGPLLEIVMARARREHISMQEAAERTACERL